MGMFDYIKCMYPLPGEVNIINFQTKSLDNCLEQYEIREDGTLWQEICKYEDHSDQSLSTPLERLRGICTKIHKGWKPYTDACTIYFYESDNNIWVEFKAQFIEGKLHKIEKVTQKQT